VVTAFPIFDWLARALVGSGVVIWLVNALNFIPAMLPDVFHGFTGYIAIVPGI